MADIVEQRTGLRLYMIGNAHLDIVWLWQYPEGLQEVKATFRSALDRMREFPEFQFVASSAAYYEWIERNDPAMFEEIRSRVAEGRWQLVGGWWVEPDLNIPSGESLVRQGLHGQLYFRSRFGRMASVGYNPDAFGHPGSLPQLLRKQRLPRYVFMRPMPNEKGLPARTFLWEADDGSRVLAFRIPFEYCTPDGDIESHIRRCAAEFPDGTGAAMCFYGVGNHGGGPTVAHLATIRRLAADADGFDVAFSGAEEFFSAVESRSDPLPVVHDELQHHAPGCYAAHSGVKGWNRRAEAALLTAEKLAAVAASEGGPPYPGEELRQGWRMLLFHQFHDVLAGTSLESAYEDARDAIGEATAVAGRALWNAAVGLAWKIAIPSGDGSTPITVFNPHGWRSETNVELETDGLAAATHVVDEAGLEHPLQTVASLATVGANRRRVLFDAVLPPLGWRVYRAVKKDPAMATATASATPPFAAGRRWRLEFDGETGWVRSLRDLVEDCEVLADPRGGRLVALDDPTDTWGHELVRLDGREREMDLERIEVVEEGPVRATLRTVHRLGASRVTQDFGVPAGDRPITVRVTVDWRQQRTALKLRWPVNLNFRRATYETPYGSIVRPCNGAEEPGQSWLDVSGVHRQTGRLYGLSILNDGKHSFDVLRREIGLTVLRSPVYAHHDPYVPERWDSLSYIDQGIQRFTYQLLPHTGGWEVAGTVQRAAELNQRAVALVDTFHEGPLPLSGSFVEVGPPNVALTTLKQAEDGSGDLVLRAYEFTGRATRATVAFPFWGRSFEVGFAPHEVKTIRIPAEGGSPREVDLLELD